ncbi:hypothetical protein EV128_12542 [Rhizobium azibense]|nr:hypothetical protein EV128_12542 [Rhizobium azibense]
MATAQTARVRLKALGMEHFTGKIGKISFVDGLSEYVTQRQAEVIGAAYETVYVNAGGAETQSANPTLRVAYFATVREGEAPSVEAPANQRRLDAEPLYLKSILGVSYTLTTDDHGYLLDFADGAQITVPANLPDDFYCTLRQGGEDQLTVLAATDVTVEEIDGFMKSEKRLAILSLARFPDGSFQLSGRTAA